MKSKGLTAAGVFAVVTLSGGAVAVAAPVSATTTQTVSVSPHSGLTDGQTVTVTLANFTDASSAHAGSGSATDIECSAAAIAAIQNGGSLPQVATQYCDTGTANQVPVDSSGDGSAPFTVASSSYTDSSGDKCDANNPCYIAAEDNPVSPLQVAYAEIQFASGSSGPTPTKTRVSVKGAAVAGNQVKATATTTPGGSLAGTVTFTDNGKKAGRVKENSAGKVSDKIKLVRGKNKIVATYSGDSAFGKSSGRRTVTAKPKAGPQNRHGQAQGQMRRRGEPVSTAPAYGR
jgi:hypothetical protein